MLISTTNNQTYWKYQTLFDTETGLRYTMMYKREKNDSPEVYVDIESASAAHSDEWGPLRYSGHEAVDFWLALKGLTSDSIVREQIRQSVTEAF